MSDGTLGQRIGEVLMAAGNQWRTAYGVAVELDVTEAQVEECVAANPERFRKSGMRLGGDHAIQVHSGYKGGDDRW